MRQETMTATSGNRTSVNSTGKAVKPNKPSQLLTNEENEQVFALLGSKRQSQCTAVVQLFTTEPAAHSTWVKKHTGVLCFVKDSIRRSYFMRLYCLHRNEMVWEHEVYDPFIINKPRPYLLTFEALDRIIAFNFASEDETGAYLFAVHSLISNRMRRKEDKKRSRPSVPPPAVVNNNNHEDTVVLRNQKATHSISTIPVTAEVPKAKVDKKTKKKLTKADIGMPTGFKHVTHVGWDQNTGFNFDGEDDEALKPFLIKAGVSEQQLKDRETKAFIYDFIQSNNVLESIKSEQLYSPPKAVEPKSIAPPVPSRHSQNTGHLQQTNNASNRVAPPPPPARHLVKKSSPPVQLEPIVQPQEIEKPRPPPIKAPAPPIRPPPITNLNIAAPTVTNTGAPPPPPPPPPALPIQITSNESTSTKTSPSSLPVITDDRCALMESIRKGTQLRKVDQISVGSSGSGDVRSDLLNEIRHGTTLRPADQRVLNPNRLSDETPTDALALALRKALEQRKGAIQSDSDDDSSESFDNDNEWDD